jgi:two-component system response regulator WspF
MGCGALDVVATPVFGPGGEIRGGEELLKKISLIGRLAGADRDAKNAGLRTQSPAGPASLPPLVVIGSSTGGPKALVAVLSRLPAALGAPVVIVQHVDVQFAHGLAEWLSEQTPLPVTLAREGARPETNTVYLAATSDHLVLGPECAFRYTPEPQDYPYKPSVDVLFRSVERHWRTRGVAVLLTGMGRDGAKGLLSLHRAGWHTIAQDEGSSIVYGMPRAAAELGGARQVLPVEKIADAIIRELQKGKPGNVFA